jgi:hypothetical protein
METEAVRLGEENPSELVVYPTVGGGDGVISRFETRALNISRCAGARRLGNGSTAHVGAWDRVGTALSWEFSGAAGKYRLEAEVAAAGEAALGVACGSTKSVAKIVPTGGLDEYRFVALGVVTLGAAAEHKLELKSQGKTWSEVRLRRVRLVSAP